MALEAVARVAHRGAASTDNSGDGAGLLTQIPHRLFFRDSYRLGLHLAARPALRRRSLLPAPPSRALARRDRDDREVLAADGIPFLGWRDVPTNPNALGPTAQASCPVIRQAPGGPPAAGHRRGCLGARAVPGTAGDGAARGRARSCPGFYVCSLSCRTVVYKALLTGTQLPGVLHRLPLSGVRERHRGLPPALLDQHAAQLAAGPAVPAAGAQRRDQHALGQPERDGHAAADAGFAGVGQQRSSGCGT